MQGNFQRPSPEIQKPEDVPETTQELVFDNEKKKVLAVTSLQELATVLESFGGIYHDGFTQDDYEAMLKLVKEMSTSYSFLEIKNFSENEIYKLTPFLGIREKVKELLMERKSLMATFSYKINEVTSLGDLSNLFNEFKSNAEFPIYFKEGEYEIYTKIIDSIRITLDDQKLKEASTTISHLVDTLGLRQKMQDLILERLKVYDQRFVEKKPELL